MAFEPEPVRPPASLPPWGRVPFDYQARLKWRALPFTDDEYRGRIRALRVGLVEQDLAGAVIHGNGIDQANIIYFTGFPNPYMGDVILVAGLDGDPILVTDAIAHGEPMHTEIYQTWVPDIRCSPNERGRYMFAGLESLAGNLRDAIGMLIPRDGAIGLGGASAPRVGQMLAAAAPSAELRSIDAALQRIRAIKTPAEIELMRRAAAVADHAFSAGLAEVRPGTSERQAAGAIAGTLVGEGAEPLYMTQVGSGPRSGFRNVRPTSRTFKAGDLVYIGFGLRYEGYCMRIGGSTAVPPAGSAEHEFLEANAAIVEEALRPARPGARTSTLVDIAETTAKRLGVVPDLWAGGHGIGAHTHDLPVIGKLSDHVLEEGMTFVFEPMLIREGFGTANAERVYVVTHDGVEALSQFPLRSWRPLDGR